MERTALVNAARKKAGAPDAERMTTCALGCLNVLWKAAADKGRARDDWTVGHDCRETLAPGVNTSSLLHRYLARAFRASCAASVGCPYRGRSLNDQHHAALDPM